MPPRKVKAQQEPRVEDTPIVFFLKIQEKIKDDIIPAGEMTSYSDILNSVESSKIGERFNNDILKGILEKTHKVSSYSDQTACFWCCHQFGWKAFHIPTVYDTYKNIYVCEGYVCSPECGLSYLYSDNKLTDNIRWYRHALLSHMYAHLYPEHHVISPAPPRNLLRMFGGPLDIEQYREYIACQNDIIMSEVHPIRVHIPTMNISAPLRDVKRYVSLSSDVFEKASESMRLKRSKPLHVNVPTLDMCIQGKM